MRGWFLPACKAEEVREALWDMIGMMKELPCPIYKIAGYRFRYIVRDKPVAPFIPMKRLFTLCRKDGRRWKPILRSVDVPSIWRPRDCIRIRREDIWQLADGYRELTEYYEVWKGVKKERQEDENQLLQDAFQDFGPPTERLE
ncbi:hypothetical protein KAR91_62030 [Candidatus Pacearchaeota archaeon]|nr:hypothetical protein [Candidatus Pacearchaeota archaeon]